MNVQRFFLIGSLILVAVIAPLVLLISAQGQTPTTSKTIQASDYRLSGPYTHNNLTIFLIHGKSIVLSKNFLTLQEARTKEGDRLRNQDRKRAGDRKYFQ